MYRAWWTGLLLLHIVGAAYFVAAGMGYWHLPGTYLDTCLTFSSLGMPSEYHHTLARVHFAVAACHAALLIWMVCWSLWRRALVFGSGEATRRARPKADLASKSQPRRAVESVGVVVAAVRRAYNAVFGRRGVFGVDNANFDLFMVLREIIETALLTVQAHRMSHSLPRVWLNRCYIVLLVTNCWSTALVHHLYHDSPSHRRVLAILWDCLLDMATTILIPLILVLDYAKDYKPAIKGFEATLWNEDVWLVNALSEFQLILIVSWADLASRLIFSAGMISAMNSMKNLLRPASNRVEPSSGRRCSTTTVSVLPRPAIAPDAMTNASTASPRATVKKSVMVRTYSFFLAPARLGPVRTKFSRVMSAVFFVWGLIIVTLHCHAELNPSLEQCKMQVRPWLVASPACSLIMLDCHSENSAGHQDDVEALWRRFEPRTVVRLVVRHCPRLEVGPAIQRFSNLLGMKLYNSTVLRWEHEAALTSTFHPSIKSLYLVRVNFTNRELPQGLQAPDFPPTLNDLEFCVTNLETLPSDIDLKWPKYSTVYLELGTDMTVVPDVLLRVAPYYLSFAGTPIRELPAALFEAEGIYYLNVGGTKVSSLPENVTRVAKSLSRLSVQNTEVAFFWSWVDKVLARGPKLEAATTPYCNELTRALRSPPMTTDSTATTNLPAHSSKLMDLSTPNLAVVRKKVTCKPTAATVYTLGFEDDYSGARTTA